MVKIPTKYHQYKKITSKHLMFSVGKNSTNHMMNIIQSHFRTHIISNANFTKGRNDYIKYRKKKPSNIALTIDLVSYPVRTETHIYIYIYIYIYIGSTN